MNAKLTLLAALTLLGPLASAAEAGSVAEKLKGARPNTWVTIHEFKTGGRAGGGKANIALAKKLVRIRMF